MKVKHWFEFALYKKKKENDLKLGLKAEALIFG
jgi:hypothetical protein